MGVKDVEKLDMAIPVHAKLYKEAWSSRLRPKLHFLGRFPLEVLLSGPADHYWCLTFERKNMDVKRAVEASNYKDASGSTTETLSFRQAFAIKFKTITNYVLNADDSDPAFHIQIKFWMG